MPELRICLLGDFRLSYDESLVTTVNTARLQSLLTYLLLRCDAPQARAHLAFSLWPNSTETQARTNLRKQVYHLRRALPNADHFLHADNKVLHWQPNAPFGLDVADFENAVAQADQAVSAGDLAVEQQSLERAVALYEGDLLPSCYDDWIMVVRERLRQRFTGALERLISLLESQRQYQAAIQYAQRLLRHDPLHEATHRRLMRLQSLSGNRAAALHTYHTCATILQRELAVEPGADTRKAYERLFKLDAVAATFSAALVSSVPLVGRNREWERLQSAWRTASGEKPHVVLLTGEAGIGKTRLAEELLVWAGRQGIPTAVARCYASEGGLAYAPLAAWLRSDALQGALASLDEVWLSEVARLLPELLVERPKLPRPLPLTESWQRRRLFEALARPFWGRRQLLLLLDDVQWCEQETLEWLPYLLHVHGFAGPKEGKQARLLLVATMRTEEMPGDSQMSLLLQGLHRNEQLTEIELRPLNKAETFSLAANVVGRELDPALAAPLYRGSEGNPLFVVEMARAGQAKSEQWIAAHGQTARIGLPLPPKVQRVIEARLAQLSPPARELVGLAATIGREFTFDVLAQANGEGEETLVRALDELCQRRIIRELGGTYDFGHNKLREVAYTALSETRRRWLHRKIAQALETLQAGNLDAGSPQLARHYDRAGDPQKAIDYYERAAAVAQDLYAHKEAITHLTRGLALLESLPDSPEQTRQEVEFCIRLGVSMMMTKGYSAPDVKNTLERAGEATRKSGDLAQRFPAVHGEFLFSLISGDLSAARAVSEQLVSMAEVAEDNTLRLLAHNTLGTVLIYEGRPLKARTHLAQCVSRYDIQQHGSLAATYIQDPAVTALAHDSQALWFLGHPDRALARAGEALALARELSQPYSLAFAYAFHAGLDQLCGNVCATQKWAEQGIIFSARHGFPFWQMMGLVQQGWALVALGEVDEGIERMQQGTSGIRNMGTRFAESYFASLLAEACIKAGWIDEGLSVVTEALDSSAATGNHFFKSELYRFQGELLLRQSGRVGQAEESFRRALEVARQQQAKSLELRAVTSLARLWQRQGRKKEARQQLAVVYEWFMEGFDTADLQAAQALLGELLLNKS